MGIECSFRNYSDLFTALKPCGNRKAINVTVFLFQHVEFDNEEVVTIYHGSCFTATLLPAILSLYNFANATLFCIVQNIVAVIVIKAKLDSIEFELRWKSFMK